MFDNPQEELKKLEQQMLAAEETETEDFETFYQQILQEFGPGTQTPPVRKTTRKPAPAGKKPSGKKPGKKKKKKLTGLIITLCLECAGILGIILWWMLRLM